MKLTEIIAAGGGLLAAVMTLLQIAPIKLNPWSWMAKAIGRAINGEVLAKLGQVEERLDKHITMDDRRTADGHRSLTPRRSLSRCWQRLTPMNPIAGIIRITLTTGLCLP